MVDDTERLKRTTDNLEAAYQSLRKAAANIVGLLQSGRATCEEITAYNVWATSLHETQASLLEALRNAGQSVPEGLPPPTIFVWKGVKTGQAAAVACGGQPTSARDVMRKAMQPPTEKTTYLSANDVDISTQDQYAFSPEQAPSFRALIDLIAKRKAEHDQQVAGLGSPGAVALILIGGVLVPLALATALGVWIYLKARKMNEESSKSILDQVDAFVSRTSARLTGDDSPTMSLDGATSWGGSWGPLHWTLALLGASAFAVAAWRVWLHFREEGFELPEGTVDAIATTTHAA